MGGRHHCRPAEKVRRADEVPGVGGREGADPHRNDVHHRHGDSPVLRQRARRAADSRVGAGYRRYVGPYNTLDVRGSITLLGYKRIEAEFLAPRLFNRRGVLSVIGGWREATQVGFYGTGTANTSADDRANYSFEQPYGSATLDCPADAQLSASCAAASSYAVEAGPGRGTRPSVERSTRPRRCPASARARPTCTRRARSALDSRHVAGLRAPRRLSTASRCTTSPIPTTRFGFKQVDYEAIQHVPILRDAWVLSLRGAVETTVTQERRADSVLHAAGARRRLVAARLLELALPRSQQPAAAGRVARHGQPLPRHGAVLRRRQGDARTPAT